MVRLGASSKVLGSSMVLGFAWGRGSGEVKGGGELNCVSTWKGRDWILQYPKRKAGWGWEEATQLEKAGGQAGRQQSLTGSDL